MKSIRKRLLLLQLSVVVLIAGAGIAGAYYRVRDLFYEMQDYHLQQVALLLLQQGELTDRGSPVLQTGEDDLDFIGQVWSENRTLVYSSHRDYALPLSTQNGLRTVVWDDEPFRVYTLSRSGWTVQVAQSMELREDALHSIAMRLVLPLALILPLLGIATWVAVGRGMRPLSALREEVVQRSPASLTPIALEHAPEEVKPLVGALNDLLSRLQEALDGQRRFTADAAHELRTPLTGIKLHFQLLERVEAEVDRQKVIEHLKDGIDRAIRLVQQLLTLARLEPAAERAPALAQVPLAPLIAQVADQFHAHAAQKQISLSVGRCDPARVMGDPEQLQTLLNNLLDNAIRYTPPGGHVTVRLTKSDSDALIEVADSGPGISAPERSRVFDRFYRIAGQAPPGSGLGLSIVQRIAEAHRGSIELGDSPMHGLLVCVRLPVLSGT